MKNDVELLSELPETISKEQLCKLCHMSKSTALYLLESGLIKCTDTGKRTHRFIIRREDFFAFLSEREQNPQKFKAPDLWYCENPEKRKTRKTTAAEYDIPSLRTFYESKLERYDELLTLIQIRLFTGYEKATVEAWIRQGHLKYLDCLKGKMIPKEWFIDFLCSEWFNLSDRKSFLHQHYINKANK